MWRRAGTIPAAALFVVGGCTDIRERGALSSVEKITFEKTDDKISARAELLKGELQIPRRSPSVFLEKSTGDLVVVGGCEYEGKHLNSYELISPDGEKNQKAPSAIPSLEGSSCSSFCHLSDKTGIVVGGFSGDDCLKQVVLIDCESLESKKLPDFISRLKNSCAIPISENEVLFLGGWDERETMTTIFKLKLNEDRSDFTVSMDGLLPYSVEGHSAVRRGDAIFIVGGYDGISVRDSIVRFDLHNQQKQVLSTRLAVPRENHVCGLVLGDYLVVAGGWNGREALDSIEVFRILDQEPFLEKVSCDVRLRSPRNRPASIVI